MPKVKVDSIQLYYEFKGQKRGDTIVFVNGLLTNTESWSQHIPFFEDDYRILLYDCRGQGRSDKPPGPYLIKQHAKDLAALLNKLEIEKASFIGLSSGGAALLHLALDHPRLVKKLIVADAYSLVDAILKAKIDAWVEAAKISSELRFLVATPYVWSNAFLEENQHLFKVFEEKAKDFPQDTAVNLIEGAKHQEINDRVCDIEAPTLIVVGEEDILTPVRYSREMHKKISGSKLEIIPKAGHASAIERADIFCGLVTEFLERYG